MCAALAGVAIAVSADVLIALGPMRISLTSPNPLTRSTAENTVLGARLLCAFAALGVTLLGIRWRSFVSSRLVQALGARAVPDEQRSAMDRVVGPSLYISGGAFVCGVAYLSLIHDRLSPRTRTMIAMEDGAIEQTTALLFLAASVLAFTTVARLIRHNDLGKNRRLRALWHGLLGVFLFMCFGEELSWGQRILGFETSTAVRQLNVQGETNLHNMLGYLADHLFILGALVYGAILPLVAMRHEFWRRALHRLGLPIASAGLAVGFFATSAMHDWTLGWLIAPIDLRVAELREFLTATCFVLLMLESRQLEAPSVGVSMATKGSA